MSDLPAICAAIERGSSFLISSHVSPDGDSIGSQLALMHLLRSLDKEVQVVNRDPVPHALAFLPGVAEILTPGMVKLPRDVTFVLDCGQSDRTGGVVTAGDPAFGTVVNIDHHVTNEPWADLNWCDSTASSTAEMIHRLVLAVNGGPDLDMACCIYTGIMSDTGSFRYRNTTAGVLGLAASLVELGVDPSLVACHVYDSVPFPTLKLLGLTLNSLSISDNGLVAWVTVSSSQLEATGTDWDATEDFINFPRSIPSVVVALCFKELPLGEVKVSMRSRGRVDVAAIAQRHGGGGHVNAAGCSLAGSLDQVRRRIVREVLEELQGLSAEHEGTHEASKEGEACT